MRISTGNFDSIFFLGVTPFLNLEIGQNERYYSTQFVRVTPLKPLNRISWNFVVMKDIMCRCAYPQEILIPLFFSELRPFWTSKFDENERYYWNSWSAQLHWNRSTELHWNFVVMKDIMCRCAFYRKCWFDPFEEQFISPFLSDCPSLMLGIAIYCIQHSLAMLERGVCELAHSFFHYPMWLHIGYLYI